jgi:hypothetical protein
MPRLIAVQWFGGKLDSINNAIQMLNSRGKL